MTDPNPRAQIAQLRVVLLTLSNTVATLGHLVEGLEAQQPPQGKTDPSNAATSLQLLYLHLAPLLWVLWNHQGSSSPIGQPIREYLGMGRFERMTPEKIQAAKEYGKLMPETATPTETAAPTNLAPEMGPWITYRGNVPTAQDLPIAPAAGDCYFVKDVRSSWEWSQDGKWVPIGQGEATQAEPSADPIKIPPPNFRQRLQSDAALAIEASQQPETTPVPLMEAYRDAIAGLRYIEQTAGRLYGVGWDRVFDTADSILSDTDCTVPTLADSLVRRVAGRIGELAGFDNWENEACAAILEIAEWLAQNGWGEASDALLRQEANDGN